MKKMDLRVVKTLKSIDEALLAELQEKQFQNVTVESICRRAQINRTTFYKHYKDKFELLNNYLDRFLDEFDVNCKKIFEEIEYTGNIHQDISSIGSRKTTDYIIHRREFCRVLWDQNFGRNCFREMVLIMAKDYKEFRLKNSPEIAGDPKKYSILNLFSGIFAATYMHSIRWWILNEPIVSEKEFNDMFCNILQNGLASVFKELI
ncbi:MAG: TetR/AcrR family transcriptional regulator [Lachnospiraceae bacterium]|nr:TetR/AcrR family transcriptional regulator [Lachnospiraceae bacterium]